MLLTKVETPSLRKTALMFQIRIRLAAINLSASSVRLTQNPDSRSAFFRNHTP